MTQNDDIVTHQGTVRHKLLHASIHISEVFRLLSKVTKAVELWFAGAVWTACEQVELCILL